MAAKFSISESDSEASEEVEEAESDQSLSREEQLVPSGLTLSIPDRNSGNRIRLSSESLVSTVSRDEDFQARGEDEVGTPTEGPPFRGRSKSAPPTFWAARKYGQQLRRMSDEFDSLLDKGQMRKVTSAGSTKQMHHSKSWWSALFSYQESDNESNCHDNHTHRNE
ncbi:bcl2-associated agonist of cell death-like [Thalassophryne amazonica]|uniref:bcl2-associated agonist of cell death-like n=1 Tax=Thalassophryne amazonica TaxID=390379 RepID=UPI00147251B2|nr:bcl2-associated agonist of cell death-like [Thalassophryne amazonica]